jgi:hypothetical protein
MLIWTFFLVLACGTRAKTCPHLSVWLCLAAIPYLIIKGGFIEHNHIRVFVS